MKTILGIDPGLSGALSFYDEAELMIYDVPTFEITTNGKKKNTVDCHRLLEIIRLQKPDVAYIENVHAMPSQGVTSMFNMGRTFGRMETAVMALDIPLIYITPNTWKKFFSCPADKDGARKRASELMPQFAHNWPLKRHDGRAEAGLIALYGMYQEKSRIILK